MRVAFVADGYILNEICSFLLLDDGSVFPDVRSLAYLSMGCMCSIPSVTVFENKGCVSGKFSSSTLAPTKSMFRRKHSTCEEKMDRGMSVAQIVKLCYEMVDQRFQGLVDPIMVAAIIIMESAGVADSCRLREDFREAAYGLGQMLFSTAEFLMKSGYDAFPLARPEDLYNPTIAVYFVCACVDYLSKHEDTGKSEEVIVKSYHNGSSHMEETPAEVWDVYLKARSQLIRLKTAMDSPPTKQLIYVVQSGESLELIGRVCGVSVQSIMDVNPDVKEADNIQTGDCIEIPVEKILPRFYVVKPNESVESIAQRHDVSLFKLYGANADLKNSVALKPGWILSIPGLKGNALDGRLRSDLISTGIDDGPFFLSSLAEHEAVRMDEDAISGSMAREYLRRSSYSRSAIQKILKRNSPN